MSDPTRPDQSKGERIESQDTSPALVTVSEKIARGKDIQARTALNISPEKRAEIERLLREGVGIVRTAQLTSSGSGTVSVVRDQMLEADPALFKRHLVANLQRVATKTAAKLEEGIDSLEEVKASQLPGLSVSLGIIVDKIGQLTGDSTSVVVEHRYKIDADSLSAMLSARRESQQAKVEPADVIDVTDSEPSGNA